MKQNVLISVCVLVIVAVAAVYTHTCWLNFTCSTQSNLGSSCSTDYKRVSAVVTPASSVRCNRISLPARFYNATTAPYNPAAMRHPVSGDWFLMHTFDVVILKKLCSGYMHFYCAVTGKML